MIGLQCSIPGSSKFIIGNKVYDISQKWKSPLTKAYTTTMAELKFENVFTNVAK